MWPLSILAANPRYRAEEEIPGTARHILLKAFDVYKKKHVAVRCYPHPLQEQEKEILFRTITIHRRVNHPNVVRFREVFRSNDFLCISMDYIDGILLTQFIDTYQDPENGQMPGCLPEPIARHIFCQVVHGIQHLHSMHAVYRNVTTDHVILNRKTGKAVICDMSLTRPDGELSRTKFIGVPYYAAPEILRHIEATYNGMMTDIWGMGVLLYYMILGQYPFNVTEGDIIQAGLPINEINRLTVLMQKIQEGNYILNEGSCSDRCLEIIRRMLQTVPEDRITMEELMEEDWFVEAGIEPFLLQMEEVQSLESIRRILND